MQGISPSSHSLIVRSISKTMWATPQAMIGRFNPSRKHLNRDQPLYSPIMNWGQVNRAWPTHSRISIKHRDRPSLQLKICTKTVKKQHCKISTRDTSSKRINHPCPALNASRLRLKWQTTTTHRHISACRFHQICIWRRTSPLLIHIMENRGETEIT